MCTTMGVVLFRLLQELSKLLQQLMTAGACTSSFSQLLFLPLLAGFVASEDSQQHVPISRVSELLHVLLLSECHVEGQAPTPRRLSLLPLLLSGSRTLVHHFLCCGPRFLQGFFVCAVPPLGRLPSSLRNTTRHGQGLGLKAQ